MKSKMIRILIIGQNSYIGNSFENFIKKFKGYECSKLSVRDYSWKNIDFSQYNVAFYVTGIAHSDNGKISKDKVKKYYKINTDLTLEVAKKLKYDGVKHFVFMSSAIVYGESAPIGVKKNITIHTLPTPVNAYGDSKLRAEIRLSKLLDKNFIISIIRSPMVYGDGCKGNYKYLEKIAKIFPIFPYVDNERSVIHIDRLCYFVKYLIDKNFSGIFLPQNDEYMNTCKEIENIARKNGKKIIFVHGTTSLLKVLSKFCPYVNKAFGNFTYVK